MRRIISPPIGSPSRNAPSRTNFVESTKRGSNRHLSRREPIRPWRRCWKCFASVRCCGNMAQKAADTCSEQRQGMRSRRMKKSLLLLLLLWAAMFPLAQAGDRCV